MCVQENKSKSLKLRKIAKSGEYITFVVEVNTPFGEEFGINGRFIFWNKHTEGETLLCSCGYAREPSYEDGTLTVCADQNSSGALCPIVVYDEEYGYLQKAVRAYNRYFSKKH